MGSGWVGTFVAVVTLKLHRKSVAPHSEVAVRVNKSGVERFSCTVNFFLNHRRKIVHIADFGYFIVKADKAVFIIAPCHCYDFNILYYHTYTLL